MSARQIALVWFHGIYTALYFVLMYIALISFAFNGESALERIAAAAFVIGAFELVDKLVKIVWEALV